MESIGTRYRGIQVRISLSPKQASILTYDTDPLEWPEELLPVVREKAEVQYQKIRAQIMANELEDAERREAACTSIT